MASNRIPGHLGVGALNPAMPTPGSATGAQGTWNGRTLKVVHGAPAQAQAHAFAEEEKALPMLMRELASRRVSLESNFRSNKGPEVLARARTLGALGVDDQKVRAGARDILRSALKGEKMPAASGRAASLTKYLSLQLVASVLEDEVKDEEVTAMLTPVRGNAQSPQGLSELLRHAANDNEGFEHFREDVLAGLDTTPDDEKELKEEFWEARRDDAKLMEVLRKTQNIPALHREVSQLERERLRQRIQDQIREFERSNEGGVVLASFNAAPTAERTSDPANFLQTYTDLVTTPRTFAAMLKLLLQRYQFEAIEAALDNLKKALGDDLVAATPSQDTRRLGAILSDLGTMSMSSSLVERVRELIALMARAEVYMRVEEKKEQGQGNRRKKGDVPADEDADDMEDSEMSGRHGARK